VYYEEIVWEGRKMIVMNVEMDNFFAFRNFRMNMSYPKKIVDSSIKGEFLQGRSNFRYKKVNILMGANATGKTSFGRFLMAVFNFMDTKQFEKITKVIDDTTQDAFFTMDFITNEYAMYRIATRISPGISERYEMADIAVDVQKVEISKKDSYESCCKKFKEIQLQKGNNFVEELEKIRGLSWLFEYPSDSLTRYQIPENHVERYTNILEKTLKALDPSIKKVERIQSVDNAFVIRMKNRNVIMQDGKVVDQEILSSGTKAGIALAMVVASIINGDHGFYYCDEKFSFIHSDIEKAFLSVMIECLKDNDQLFFTTHNTDILDLHLPKHTFAFLKKDIYDEQEPIKCISASDYLKRNTDSLRNAVENDLFSSAPNVEFVYEIANLCQMN
jgi:AAA15 family ATPase/GTPase